MPAGKAVIIILETGHDTQPASGLYQCIQLSEHPGRLVQMLHHLGTGYKVIRLRQRFPGRTEEWVVNRHREPRLLEHGGQCGPRTTAKIKPAGSRGQLCHQRISNLCQKPAITRVFRPVVVEPVEGLFILFREVELWCHHRCLTNPAAQIQFAFHLHKPGQCRTFTYGAWGSGACVRSRGRA